MKKMKGGLSKEELSEARRCVARGRRTGELLDRATVQRLREQLWKKMYKELDVQAVKVVMPLIQANRRAELQAKLAFEAKRQLSLEGQEHAVRRMYGPLPWMKSANAERTEGTDQVQEPASAEGPLEGGS